MVRQSTHWFFVKMMFPLIASPYQSHFSTLILPLKAQYRSAILLLQSLLPLNPSFLSHIIQWRGYGHEFIFSDMQVSLGGADIKVTQQIFDIANVHTFFHQMSGKGVPQRVKTYLLLNARPYPCNLKNLLCTRGL
jgi:hypothetical protein